MAKNRLVANKPRCALGADKIELLFVWFFWVSAIKPLMSGRHLRVYYDLPMWFNLFMNSESTILYFSISIFGIL